MAAAAATASAGGRRPEAGGPPFLLKVRAGCTKEDIRLLLALGIPGFRLARGGGRGRLLSAPRPRGAPRDDWLACL